MTFATWSQTAASNTSVGGISTDGNVTLVNQIDNMFRGMMAELALARDNGTVSATAERGYLHGLTLSNNAGDATNDIDIAAGEAVTSDSPYWKMALASTLTKRLDAAWAVGSGNGGLDTGSIADATYHVWLIARSDTGVVDALFSTSATSPTMPTNYDRKRRIGSIIRFSATIRPFDQVGDVFTYRTPLVDRNSTAAAAAALLALSVPLGIVVFPILVLKLAVNASGDVKNSLGSALATTVTEDVQQVIATASAVNVDNANIPPIYATNTSRQIYFRCAISAGTINFNILSTNGYVDTRGQNG